MPLYEYKCTDCGEIFEVRQRFSDTPLTQHDSGCGGAVERLLSAPALQFKGSGWYITDYARGGGNNGGKKDANASAKSETKADSGSASSASSSTSTASSSDKS